MVSSSSIRGDVEHVQKHWKVGGDMKPVTLTWTQDYCPYIAYFITIKKNVKYYLHGFVQVPPPPPPLSLAFLFEMVTTSVILLAPPKQPPVVSVLSSSVVCFCNFSRCWWSSSCRCCDCISRSLHILCALHLSWWFTISKRKLEFPSTKEVRMSGISFDQRLQYVQYMKLLSSSCLSHANWSNQFGRKRPPFRVVVLLDAAPGLLLMAVELTIVDCRCVGDNCGPYNRLSISAEYLVVRMLRERCPSVVCAIK